MMSPPTNITASEDSERDLDDSLAAAGKEAATSANPKALIRRSSSIRQEEGPRGPSHRKKNNNLDASDKSDIDSTAHRIRGGGILASRKDLSVAPEEFAAGCQLLQAAALGNLDRLKSLLSKHPSHVNFRDYDRRTALHVAASEGHLDVVELLVERGSGINRSDRWGGSPLDDAHRHRHPTVVKYLRGLGATTGSADQTTNLITAAAEGDLDEVRMLLTAAVSATDDKGKGKGAGGARAVEVVPPISVDAGDYDHRTALHLAAGEGHADVVELLCRKGANVNIEDRWGGRPLDDAKRREFAKCVEILEKYGAKPGKTAPPAMANGSSKRSLAAPATEEDNMVVDFAEIEMIERIGSGAFGEIYKCRWRGILVAAKCIKSAKIQKEWRSKHKEKREGGNGGGGGRGRGTTPGGGGANNDKRDVSMDESEKEAALEDFRIETSILRTLRHPNICMLLAYSTTNDFEVMISELMKCSLLDIFKANALHNSQMPKKTQIVYAQQLGQGMNYLHTCKPPIIHRDLKPANLLVDFSGTLKISDFGLAKIRPDHTTEESDQFLMTGETGSYRFMAPEVFRHEDYTETVDIYSYAMILYYMLAGKAPWSSCNGLKAVQKASIDGERPFIPREWDGRLSALLQRCWDENPKSRPPFSEILKILGDYSRDVFRTDRNSVTLAEPDRRCNCVIS